jgi:preprotein translocase subunit SecG
MRSFFLFFFFFSLLFLVIISKEKDGEKRKKKTLEAYQNSGDNITGSKKKNLDDTNPTTLRKDIDND